MQSLFSYTVESCTTSSFYLFSYILPCLATRPPSPWDQTPLWALPQIWRAAAGALLRAGSETEIIRNNVNLLWYERAKNVAEMNYSNFFRLFSLSLGKYMVTQNRSLATLNGGIAACGPNWNEWFSTGHVTTKSYFVTLTFLSFSLALLTDE